MNGKKQYLYSEEVPGTVAILFSLSKRCPSALKYVSLRT